MSRYGPSGGHPGRPGGPSGPPSDPWRRGQESWSDLTGPQPAYAEPPPGGYRSPYGQTPPSGTPLPYGEPPPPPRRRHPGLTVVLVTLVLLVAGGIAATLFWISGGDGDTAAVSGGTVTDAGPSPSATATGGGGRDVEVPEDRIGMGPVVAQQDDCLVNDGSDVEPVMRIVPCDSGEGPLVFRVLSRHDQQVAGDSAAAQDQSAQQICTGTDGYEHHYWFVGEVEDEGYVLCMAEL